MVIPPTPSYRDGWRAVARPKNWKRTRERILKRDGALCQLRYGEICIGKATDVDHIISASKGGSEDDANLQAACGPCHRTKTARDHGWGSRPKRARPQEQHPGAL